MNDWCNRLKEKLEKSFSMPFDVAKTTSDGEDVYLCNPTNGDNLFFVIKAYVRNQIRLVVEIYPQNNASAILAEMSAANKNKQEVFFQYVDVLCNAGAKVHFYVNDEITSLCPVSNSSLNHDLELSLELVHVRTNSSKLGSPLT